MIIGGGFDDIRHLTVGEDGAIAIGIGNHQPSDSGDVRASHGSALHILITAADVGAVNTTGGKDVSFAAGSRNIHPGVVIGIIGPDILIVGGCHGKGTAIAGRIPLTLGIVIPGGKDGDAAIEHCPTAMDIEIVNGVQNILIIGIHIPVTPAVLGNGGSVVRSIEWRQMETTAGGICKDLTGHQADPG